MDRGTVGTVFDRVALGDGDHPACVFAAPDLRWSYRELHEQTQLVAKGLLGLGVGAGERVAVWSTSRPEWLPLQLAVAKIGAVLVPINAAHDADELTRVLTHSGASTLFAIERSRRTRHDTILGTSCPELARATPGRLASRRLPALKRVAVLGEGTLDGALDWVDVLRAGAGISDHIVRRSEEAVDPHDPVALQYTSGATGPSKAAVLTHRNVLACATGVGACLRLGSADRLCLPAPPHHALGWLLGTTVAIVHGATAVVPAEEFDAGRTLTMTARERCSVLHGTPAMFTALLAHPRFDTFELSSLRTGILTGPCQPGLVREVVERMRARQLTILYGQAEATAAITQTRSDDPVSERASTVGRPIPGMQIKVVDESGREAAPGVAGELCCRGPVVMQGYHEPSEARADVIDGDGWLHTGDRAEIDEHGYCRLLGRTSDVVMRSGRRIDPRDVETHVRQLPSVADVRVFGVADPVRGQELAAWVRPAAGTTVTEDEVRAFCARLPDETVPRYVRLVAEYPRTVDGEIQTYKMRDQVERELGLVTRVPRESSE